PTTSNYASVLSALEQAINRLQRIGLANYTVSNGGWRHVDSCSLVWPYLCQTTCAEVNETVIQQHWSFGSIWEQTSNNLYPAMVLVELSSYFNNGGCNLWVGSIDVYRATKTWPLSQFPTTTVANMYALIR